MIDRFTNRNIDGLPTLHIQQSNQGNITPSTPTFGNSGQQRQDSAMISRVGVALGRGAISQSAASVVAASSTGLKRLFEQAKEGAVKKEGKLVLLNVIYPSLGLLYLICKVHSCILPGSILWHLPMY